MLRFLRSKSLWALALPMVMFGAAYAGGAHCDHGNKTVAAHDKHEDSDHSDNGTHCNLMKNVSKSAKMTDDGAIITIKGKTDDAVKHIQEHLAAHDKGADCPDCPMSMEGVKATVKMTGKGGEVTLTGNSPETIKKVQEWAKKPAGDCCGKNKTT